MKKILSLICVMACLFSLCACSGKKSNAEGINTRNITRFSPVLTDGENDYIKFKAATGEEFVRLDKDDFTLMRTDAPTQRLTAKKRESTIVIYLRWIGNEADEVKVSTEQKKLYEKLQSKLKDYDNYELIVIKEGDKLYGAVNCYTRVSGDNDDELCYENLEASYIITVKNDKPKLSKKINDTAILAVGDTHYIGYSNGMFYSVENSGKNKTELFSDRWLNLYRPADKSVKFYFTGDVFLASGATYEGDSATETVIACKIDGSKVKMLLNDRRV